MIALSPKEIAEALGDEHTAGSLAATVAAFWPTIKAALLVYERDHPKKVRPKPMPD